MTSGSGKLFGLSGGSVIIREGLDDEITGKRDTSLFGNRRGNCPGANLRPGPDGPTGNIAHECGAEECDFKILQRSGQCQRTARQGAVEIQIRVQEGRRQGRVRASGGTGGLASQEPLFIRTVTGKSWPTSRRSTAKAIHGKSHSKPKDSIRAFLYCRPTNCERANRALRHVSMDFYHRFGAVVFRRGTGTVPLAPARRQAQVLPLVRQRP